MSMIIEKLPSGDEVHRYQRCLVVPFDGKRKVMSTSMHNGGYREDLTGIYNHDVNPSFGKSCDYYEYGKEGDEKHKRFIEEKLGLDFEKTAYMATIVSMDNAAISTHIYDELAVTAVSTASVELNGGRAGDPATSYERRGESILLNPGTINIMIFVNADMTPGCMARAIVTATEAKTAVLQELLAGSMRSSGIATGTGTDNIMIIANSESDNLLTYAGKHGKLGELIGLTAMETVRQSLERHMGLSAKSQHNVFARLERFGVTEESFINGLNRMQAGRNVPQFMDNVHKISADGKVLALTSLYVHLLDQLRWGMIMPEEAVSSGELLLDNIAAQFEYQRLQEEAPSLIADKCVDAMLERYVSEIIVAALYLPH